MPAGVAGGGGEGGRGASGDAPDPCGGNNILDTGTKFFYNSSMGLPETLQQVILYFADADNALAFAVRMRWPDGVITCPRCESTQSSFIATRRVWECKGCKKQFSVKVGTIFEDSPI